MGLIYSRKVRIFFIILALLVILVGKFLITANSEYGLLYIYGVSVTLSTLLLFYIAFTKYRDPYYLSKNIPESKKKRYFASLLVAVKNEEKDIEECIKSLVNQTYKNREIIFVNDASTDGTAQILDFYARKKLIWVIHLKENVGKKRALAKAMLMAKGEIFVFSDSDTVVALDAVEKIVDVFNVDPLIGAVSGHCRALNGNENFLTKIQDSWYDGQFSIKKAFESVYGVVTCVSGPLAAFRKEAIFNFIPAWENDKFLGEEFRFATDRTLTGFVLGSKAVGGKLKAKYKDSPFVKDVDYPLKEWKIVYCKAARAWTIVPNTFKKLLRQQVRWKKSFIRNVFFTGTFYWRKPFFPVLYYYLHILFVIAGPFIAFRHLVLLPMNGDMFSAFLYLSGIIFVGFMFGVAYRLENRGCHKWVYRPLMSLMSTLLLSWLLFYSLFTIRKKIWSRG